jgi:hypothetical protein
VFVLEMRRKGNERERTIRTPPFPSTTAFEEEQIRL